MKIFIVSLLLVAVVSAQFDHHDDHHDDHRRQDEMIKALLDRGHLLLRVTREVLEKHRMEGGAHLLQAIEHEVIEIEALMKDLESIHPDDLRSLHHFHVVEETLLYHEHRISEEIAILEEHQRDHHNEDHHHDSNRLIQEAEELIRRAKETMERHRHADRRELEALRHEIEAVQQLVERIRRNPNSRDIDREEEELARHERSLNQLIERLDHEHHRHHDDPYY